MKMMEKTKATYKNAALIVGLQPNEIGATRVNSSVHWQHSPRRFVVAC